MLEDNLLNWNDQTFIHQNSAQRKEEEEAAAARKIHKYINIRKNNA